MEGGTTLLDWISYGIIGFILFAMVAMLLRSAWFFLSLLAIPVTDTLSRTRLGGAVQRWGERGAPVSAAAAAADVAHGVAPTQVPRAVRRGAAIGAALGAMPGIWWAVRGALATMRAGGSTIDALTQAALALGLVAPAGLLVGTAVGVCVGLAVDAVRRTHAR